VRGALGGGQPSIQVLKANDANLLVYGTLNGSGSAPGYIVAINNNATSAKSATVTTANAFLYGKTLQCYAWYSYASGQNTQPANISCSSGGLVTVQAPARGYAVYSPAPCSTPATPTGLSATGGVRRVVVSWLASSGATSYNVNRASGSAGPYTQIASGGTTNSYTDTGLPSGTTNFYTVNAVNFCATSSPSAYISASTAPDAPTALNATPGDAQVSLSWSGSAGAISYKVKNSTTNGGPFTTVAAVATTAYTNVNLANGTNYYFVVSALNSGGESANSSQISARPVSLTSPLLGWAQSSTQLQFSWPPDHLGWRLESQTNSAGAGLGTNWFPLAASDATNLWFISVDNSNPSVFLRLVYP